MKKTVRITFIVLLICSIFALCACKPNPYDIEDDCGLIRRGFDSVQELEQFIDGLGVNYLYPKLSFEEQSEVQASYTARNGSIGMPDSYSIDLRFPSAECFSAYGSLDINATDAQAFSAIPDWSYVGEKDYSVIYLSGSNTTSESYNEYLAFVLERSYNKNPVEHSASALALSCGEVAANNITANVYMTYLVGNNPHCYFKTTMHFAVDGLFYYVDITSHRTIQNGNLTYDAAAYSGVTASLLQLCEDILQLY